MRDPNPSPPVLEVLRFSVFAKDRPLLRDIELRIPDRSVFAIVGPSGIGKTTLLRSLNRLTDLTPDLRREGDIRFRGESIHDPRVNPDSLRARVGILFQQPVVFPGSILHNVLFGVRHVFRVSRRDAEDIAERALRDAALWAETRDRLHAPAARLSVCLARTRALRPEVLLLDEPPSALDAASAAAVEETLLQLRSRCAMVWVTHDMAQARRVADDAARLGAREGAAEVIARGAQALSLNLPDTAQVPEAAP
jgi:phosphate transport system ATP-binding protein